MEEIKDEIKNKKFSQLLSDGFKLFGKHYKILVLTWLVFTLIYQVLFVFLLTDIKYLYFNNTIPRVLYLIIFFIISGTLGIIYVIPLCSVSSYLFKGYINFNADFKEEFKKALNYKLKYPIFISLVLFIIFGVIFELIQDFFLESLYHTGTSVVWIMILTQIISIPVVFISLILTSLYIFVRYTYNIEDIERPISDIPLYLFIYFTICSDDSFPIFILGNGGCLCFTT